MQVILKQDVDKIGRRGEIIDVSRGYVRNFPRAGAVLAEMATPGKLEEVRHEMEEAESVTGAWPRGQSEIAGILNKSVITRRPAPVRTSPSGFVTAANIASVVPRGLAMSGSTGAASGSTSPEKLLGTHQVPIQVHGDVEASVKVIVVPKL